MTYYGIDAQQASIINVPPEDMAHALRHGDVGVVATWEPYAFETVALLKDEARFIRHPQEIYKETFNAVALNRYGQQHTEVLKRLTQAISTASTFMHNNDRDAQAIVIKMFPDQDAFMRAVWPDFVFGLGLDQSFIMTLEREAKWAMRRGLTESPGLPNYLRYVYFDALEAMGF